MAHFSKVCAQIGTAAQDVYDSFPSGLGGGNSRTSQKCRRAVRSLVVNASAFLQHTWFSFRQSRLDAPDLSDTSKMSAESRKVPILANDALAWSRNFNERKCSLSWTSCKIA